MQQAGLNALTANHLASKGRGPDTMLVHMAPSEVNSLKGLAQGFGGDLTINPETGLHEAGFLSAILPTVLGAALTATGVGAPIAAAMVGLGTGAITGDIKQGLMAGLGAFGGASLGAAAGLGKAGAQTAAQAATSAIPEAALTGSFAPGAALPGVAGAAGALPGAAAGALPGAVTPGLAQAASLGGAAVPAAAAAPTAGLTALTGGGAGSITSPLLDKGTQAAVSSLAGGPPPPAAVSSILSNPVPGSGVMPPTEAAAGAITPPPGAPPPPKGFLGKFADTANKGTHLPKGITTSAAAYGLAAPLMQQGKMKDEEEEESAYPYLGPYKAQQRSVIDKPTGGPLSSKEHLWFDNFSPEVTASKTQAQYDAEQKGKKGKKFAEGGAVSPGGKGAQAQTPQASQSSPGGKGAKSPAMAGGQQPSGDQQNQMAAYSQMLNQHAGGLPGMGTQAAQDAQRPDMQKYLSAQSAQETMAPQQARADQDAQSATMQSLLSAQGAPGTDPNALPIGGSPYAGQSQTGPMTMMSQAMRNRRDQAVGGMASPGGKGAQAQRSPAQQSSASPGGKGAQSSAPKTFARGGAVNLKEGAFVLDARTVSEIGNGSSSAGLEVLKKRLGAKHIKGKGHGVSDDIPARIGKQPARVARDEAYIPPEHVARIGGGDPRKGAQKLYQLMDHAHKTRASAKRGQDTGLAKRLA